MFHVKTFTDTLLFVPEGIVRCLLAPETLSQEKKSINITHTHTHRNIYVQKCKRIKIYMKKKNSKTLQLKSFFSEVLTHTTRNTKYIFKNSSQGTFTWCHLVVQSDESTASILSCDWWMKLYNVARNSLTLSMMTSCLTRSSLKSSSTSRTRTGRSLRYSKSNLRFLSSSQASCLQ